MKMIWQDLYSIVMEDDMFLCLIDVFFFLPSFENETVYIFQSCNMMQYLNIFHLFYEERELSSPRKFDSLLYT